MSEDGSIEITQLKTDFSGRISNLVEFLEVMQNLCDDDALCKEILEEAKQVLHNLQSDSGHGAVLLGANGLGKTTLLNLMLRLTSTDPYSYKSTKTGKLEAYTMIRDPEDCIQLETITDVSKEKAQGAAKEDADAMEALRKFSLKKAMSEKNPISIPKVLEHNR